MEACWRGGLGRPAERVVHVLELGRRRREEDGPVREWTVVGPYDE